ncbi:ribosomal protein S18-alanine N-acetyltransferase [Frateuria aurantia]
MSRAAPAEVLDFRIRPMQMTDVPAVMRVEDVAYEFPWTAGIFNDCLRAGYQGWLLECEGQLAGYAMLAYGVDEAHLLNVCIGPDWQGRGLGRYLMRHILASTQRQGVSCVFLEVRPSNPHALSLYQSLGFLEVGRRPRYYPARDGREEAIVMRRDGAAG